MDLQGVATVAASAGEAARNASAVRRRVRGQGHAQVLGQEGVPARPRGVYSEGWSIIVNCVLLHALGFGSIAIIGAAAAAAAAAVEVATRSDVCNKLQY